MENRILQKPSGAKPSRYWSNSSESTSREPAFASIHPAVSFSFFALVVLFTFCFSSPIYLLLSFTFACITYFACEGPNALKLLSGMLLLSVFLAFVSPFFNPSGETVLFTYFDRPYTLQAIVYGASIAIMFSAVIIWFAASNKVLTQDSITYLFGKMAPSVALVVVMTGRMISRFRRRLTEIFAATRCLCTHRRQSENVFSRIRESASALPAFTLWAFDCGIVTSDSMRSRGFALPKKTTFSIFRFDSRDAVLLLGIAMCAAILVFAMVTGMGSATYLPSVELYPVDNMQLIAYLVYAVFLSIPLLFEIWDRASWRFSISKI